ncbi:MAG: hypothetical protein V3V93_03300 [bacterium]
MDGEAEFCDFAAVTGPGSAEDFVAEAEVAVLYVPVDLGGQGVDQAELGFFGFTTVPKKGDNRHGTFSQRENRLQQERNITVE